MQKGFLEKKDYDCGLDLEFLYSILNIHAIKTKTND